MRVYYRCRVSKFSLHPPAFVLQGIPLGFFLLVRKYKKAGMLNDPDIKRMIGWLHEPFREDCEWWLSIERYSSAEHFYQIERTADCTCSLRPGSSFLHSAPPIS